MANNKDRLSDILLKAGADNSIKDGITPAQLKSEQHLAHLKRVLFKGPLRRVTQSVVNRCAAALDFK